MTDHEPLPPQEQKEMKSNKTTQNNNKRILLEASCPHCSEEVEILLPTATTKTIIKVTCPTCLEYFRMKRTGVTQP